MDSLGNLGELEQATGSYSLEIFPPCQDLGEMWSFLSWSMIPFSRLQEKWFSYLSIPYKTIIRGLCVLSPPQQASRPPTFKLTTILCVLGKDSLPPEETCTGDTTTGPTSPVVPTAHSPFFAALRTLTMCPHELIFYHKLPTIGTMFGTIFLFIS